MRRAARARSLLLLLLLLLLLDVPLAEGKAKRSRRQQAQGSVWLRDPPALPELTAVAERPSPSDVPNLPPNYELDQHHETSPDGHSAHVAAGIAYDKAECVTTHAAAAPRAVCWPADPCPRRAIRVCTISAPAFSQASFAAACRDSPSNFRTWMNLGMARTTHGRPPIEALEAFRYGRAKPPCICRHSRLSDCCSRK